MRHHSHLHRALTHPVVPRPTPAGAGRPPVVRALVLVLVPACAGLVARHAGLDGTAVLGAAVLGALAARSAQQVLAALGVLLLAPVLLAVAAAVKLTSRGPVLLRRERRRRDGRTVSALAFRCTRGGTGDLTPLGRVLRRYALDGLPGLLDVVAARPSHRGR
ncbi:sugar transferase [Geodermatophilus ruber]|uniref:Sugar transferase n=1 Tax=Geodermatophilus ruber TaxID=504800 RepID=A0A1I4DH67_9ACTN|nr:sugar transferase [Geodermatophilus ruber]SFK91817.1 sugar transferase [Geodermatophilus ruber]